MSKIIIEAKMTDEQLDCLVDEIINTSEIIGIDLEIQTITAEVCPECGTFDKSHDPVVKEWVCRKKECKTRWNDGLDKNDITKEFTPEFLKKFMFDAEFRTIFESISRGGSPYEMIEHLCKSKKEISELLEKMVINFGPIKKEDDK